jgi:hypothetical protein
MIPAGDGGYYHISANGRWHEPNITNMQRALATPSCSSANSKSRSATNFWWWWRDGSGNKRSLKVVYERSFRGFGLGPQGVITFYNKANWICWDG